MNRVITHVGIIIQYISDQVSVVRKVLFIVKQVGTTCPYALCQQTRSISVICISYTYIRVSVWLNFINYQCESKQGSKGAPPQTLLKCIDSNMNWIEWVIGTLCT